VSSFHYYTQNGQSHFFAFSKLKTHFSHIKFLFVVFRAGKGNECQRVSVGFHALGCLKKTIHFQILNWADIKMLNGKTDLESQIDSHIWNHVVNGMWNVCKISTFRWTITALHGQVLHLHLKKKCWTVFLSREFFSLYKNFYNSTSLHFVAVRKTHQKVALVAHLRCKFLSNTYKSHFFSKAHPVWKKFFCVKDCPTCWIPFGFSDSDQMCNHAWG